jgi:hypothetical protein
MTPKIPATMAARTTPAAAIAWPRVLLSRELFAPTRKRAGKGTAVFAHDDEGARIALSYRF